MLTYLIYFAIIILIIAISFAYYYGILDKLEIHSITLPSCECMYYPIRGDYSKKMALEYENISNAIYGNKAAHQAYNRAGRLMLGVYYDNPYTVNLTNSTEYCKIRDKSRMRAAVGFIFKPSSQDDREHIIEQLSRLGFKYAKFKSTKCVYTEFEVKFPSIVAYMSVPAQFYREVDEYINKRKRIKSMLLNSSSDLKICSFELYSETHIYLHKPLENFEDFDLISNSPIEKVFDVQEKDKTE